jgi:radical SAM protein with 4Fe4S-binding SPASM domain
MQNGQNSYLTIIDNLKDIPYGISLFIRVNCNAQTIQGIDELLEDLYKRKIWPHNAKQVKIELAFMRGLLNNCHSYLSLKDYYDFTRIFVDKKLALYNRWAVEQGKKKARKRLEYPNPSFLYCRTLHNHYGLTINQDGDISKCFHYVNSPQHQLQNVSNNFANISKNNQFRTLVHLNPIGYDEECYNCKVLPICGYTCPDAFIDKKAEKYCCQWKYNLEEIFKKQFLLRKEHPDLVQKYEEIAQNTVQPC